MATASSLTTLQRKKEATMTWNSRSQYDKVYQVGRSCYLMIFQKEGQSRDLLLRGNITGRYSMEWLARPFTLVLPWFHFASYISGVFFFLLQFRVSSAIPVFHGNLGIVTGGNNASLYFGCIMADALLFCRNSSFVFPWNIGPGGRQNSTVNPRLIENQYISGCFSTAYIFDIILCNHCLLQNDKL